MHTQGYVCLLHICDMSSRCYFLFPIQLLCCSYCIVLASEARKENVCGILVLAQVIETTVFHKEIKMSRYVGGSKVIKIKNVLFNGKNIIFLKVRLLQALAFESRMHLDQILFSCCVYNHRYDCQLVRLVCKRSVLTPLTFCPTLPCVLSYTNLYI